MGDEEKIKNQVGRPRLEFDIELLKGLCEIQCTAEECAAVMKMSVDTIDNRLKENGYTNFSDFYKTHSQEGKQSLRRVQWEQAIGGNTTMLIWLGKQQLGQRDKHEVKAEGGLTIKWDKGGCEGI